MISEDPSGCERIHNPEGTREDRGQRLGVHHPRGEALCRARHGLRAVKRTFTSVFTENQLLVLFLIISLNFTQECNNKGVRSEVVFALLGLHPLTPTTSEKRKWAAPWQRRQATNHWRPLIPHRMGHRVTKKTCHQVESPDLQRLQLWFRQECERSRLRPWTSGGTYTWGRDC